MMGLVAVLALATGPIVAYNQGNQLYARKDYPAAALAYQQALVAGPNAAVHFNLANALFKSGRIGQAIIHYRRARYLDPRDGDIATNLSFARAYRVDKMLASQSPLSQALDVAFHGLSRREATLLGPIFFTLAGACLSLWIVRRWAPLVVVAVLCGAASLYGIVSQRTWAAEIGERPAVVVVPEVNALSGPGEEFKQILLVHDGTEVKIREARGDYLLVQLPGGGGWVPKQAVERVY
jgi:tetratricopeptide (TPR) repeat protein